MNKPQVVFVTGYLCAGKGTYCEKVLKEYTRITVSDIVRRISGAVTRKELQDTAHFDELIVKEICDILLANPRSRFAIDGIRQRSVYDGIVRHVSENLFYQTIWLDTPIEECKKRFETRKDRKDNITFEEAFDRDNKLGLDELRLYLKKLRCIMIRYDKS